LDIASAAQWWDALSPVLERAFSEVGFDEARARSLVRQVRGVYSDPARWRLFDDVIPTLVHLSSQDWTHVLLSNHVPELPEIIHHLELGSYLAGIFNSAETGYEKPHPQAFLNVLEAIGSPTAVWMIGDSYTADVSGAEAVGIPAILVRRTHVEARYACDQLAQVSTIVDG
jgi:putative hydrolase of the HAD superfamily